MTSTDLTVDPGGGRDWVPDACTLPSVEQPLRLAAFDGLFTTVTAVERVDSTHATLTLAGAEGLAARAQDLADRETACCSFFTFAVTPMGSVAGAYEAARMSIAVPETHAAVLAALVERAEQQAGR